jgi:hypothetical protein
LNPRPRGGLLLWAAVGEEIQVAAASRRAVACAVLTSRTGGQESDADFERRFVEDARQAAGRVEEHRCLPADEDGGTVAPGQRAARHDAVIAAQADDVVQCALRALRRVEVDFAGAFLDEMLTIGDHERREQPDREALSRQPDAPALPVGKGERLTHLDQFFAAARRSIEARFGEVVDVVVQHRRRTLIRDRPDDAVLIETVEQEGGEEVGDECLAIRHLIDEILSWQDRAFFNEAEQIGSEHHRDIGTCAAARQLGLDGCARVGVASGVNDIDADAGVGGFKRRGIAVEDSFNALTCFRIGDRGSRSGKVEVDGDGLLRGDERRGGEKKGDQQDQTQHAHSTNSSDETGDSVVETQPSLICNS